jgi:hypothetical protein
MSYNIALSLNSDDARQAVFRFLLVILGMMKSVFQPSLENAIRSIFTP